MTLYRFQHCNAIISVLRCSRTKSEIGEKLYKDPDDGIIIPKSIVHRTQHKLILRTAIYKIYSILYNYLEKENRIF